LIYYRRVTLADPTGSPPLQQRILARRNVGNGVEWLLAHCNATGDLAAMIQLADDTQFQLNEWQGETAVRSATMTWADLPNAEALVDDGWWTALGAPLPQWQLSRDTDGGSSWWVHRGEAGAARWHLLLSPSVHGQVFAATVPPAPGTTWPTLDEVVNNAVSSKTSGPSAAPVPGQTAALPPTQHSQSHQTPQSPVERTAPQGSSSGAPLLDALGRFIKALQENQQKNFAALVPILQTLRDGPVTDAKLQPRRASYDRVPRLLVYFNNARKTVALSQNPLILRRFRQRVVLSLDPERSPSDARDLFLPVLRGNSDIFGRWQLEVVPESGELAITTRIGTDDERREPLAERQRAGTPVVAEYLIWLLEDAFRSLASANGYSVGQPVQRPSRFPHFESMDDKKQVSNAATWLTKLASSAPDTGGVLKPLFQGDKKQQPQLRLYEGVVEIPEQGVVEAFLRRLTPYPTVASHAATPGGLPEGSAPTRGTETIHGAATTHGTGTAAASTAHPLPPPAASPSAADDPAAAATASPAAPTPSPVAQNASPHPPPTTLRQARWPDLDLFVGNTEGFIEALYGEQTQRLWSLLADSGSLTVEEILKTVGFATKPSLAAALQQLGAWSEPYGYHVSTSNDRVALYGPNDPARWRHAIPLGGTDERELRALPGSRELLLGNPRKWHTVQTSPTVVSASIALRTQFGHSSGAIVRPKPLTARTLLIPALSLLYKRLGAAELLRVEDGSGQPTHDGSIWRRADWNPSAPIAFIPALEDNPSESHVHWTNELTAITFDEVAAALPASLRPWWNALATPTPNLLELEGTVQGWTKAVDRLRSDLQKLRRTLAAVADVAEVFGYRITKGPGGVQQTSLTEAYTRSWEIAKGTMALLGATHDWEVRFDATSGILFRNAYPVPASEGMTYTTDHSRWAYLLTRLGNLPSLNAYSPTLVLQNIRGYSTLDDVKQGVAEMTLLMPELSHALRSALLDPKGGTSGPG
jgi:hypothetical protein